MKDDERDTQKMTLRTEDVQAAEVRAFKYHTDPGPSDDPDRELINNVSRARDAREERADTIGLILDELPKTAEIARAPISHAPPAQTIRVVHTYSFPARVTAALLVVGVALVVLAMLIVASKDKKGIDVAPQAPLATTRTTAPSTTTLLTSIPPPPIETAMVTTSAFAPASTSARPPPATTAAMPRSTATAKPVPPLTQPMPSATAKPAPTEIEDPAAHVFGGH